MIRLCLGNSDVIHANERTQHANCGLLVNFWNLRLMSLCFITKKDHLKRKLLLSPQVPFKNFAKFTGKHLLRGTSLEAASAKNLSYLSVFIAV